MFTALLGLFDSRRMKAPALRERFERTVGAIPGQVAETLADIDAPAFGGTGAWLDESAPHENLFLALPLAAAEPPDPTRLLAILHLGDDANTRHANYRPAWNRTLRLFNLLQFLPDTWWITRQGVQAGYPELGPAGEARVDATPPDSDEWAAATELAAEPLHAAMRQWTAAGLPMPEVGFELADDKGEVHAEAELAWPSERVAVLYGEQAEQVAAFERAGWQVCLVGEDGEGAERIIKP